MSDGLPRGVWYEESRNRYRIRKYRNNKPYLLYRATREEALEAYKQLCEKVAKIKRHKRGEKISGPVPTSTFAGLAQAVQEAAENT